MYVSEQTKNINVYSLFLHTNRRIWCFK